MKKTDNKTGQNSNKKNRQICASEATSKIFTFIMATVAIFLLFPVYSNLSVFSKGEFTYLESIGMIFVYLTLLFLVLFHVVKTYLKLKINKQFVRYLFYVITIGASVFLSLLIIMFIWIRFDVKTHCEDVKYKFGGSCIEALSKQLEDVSQGYRSRNSAIWALGQLGDNKSLPILNKYYTGKIPKKEPLNMTISQYELQKAIRWCEKGNITSWMYKGF